jgi:hypothetical protein
MKYFNKIILLCLSLVVFAACEDDGEYDHPLVQDVTLETPVLFPGAVTFGANPFYSLTMSSGVITINIAIPDSSPRTISTISLMSAGATGLTPANLTAKTTNTTVANYIAAPITVNGKTATINTSITEFNSKFPASAPATTRLVPPTPPATVGGSFPAGTVFVERAFMFQLTLDDGSNIISQQLRIRVTYP